jgi:molecular chaperone Hsp33
MNSAAKNEWDDTILPFQLDRSDIRGRVARLDGALEQMLRQHNYPAEVSGLLAEAAILTALIGQTIDLRWKLSLQIRGDGPIRIIATDFFGPRAKGAPAKMRAYASYDAAQLAAAAGTPFEKIGKGMFAVLIDQGSNSAPYQGVTPLAGGSLAQCAQNYFSQSEQLPTRFALAVAQSSLPGTAETWRGGGVMLQHMPKASPLMSQKEPAEDEVVPAAGQDQNTDTQENWTRVTTLLDTAEETELIGPLVSPRQLLTRLFHEENPRVFDPQTVQFGCTCGPDKVRQTMSIYSAKDIRHMTNEHGKLTADCQFCGAHYEFDPQTLGFEAKP